MAGSDSKAVAARTPVWITRTEPAASRLAEQCRLLTLDPVIQPLLAIEPLEPSMPGRRFDLAICLSVHAARGLSGQRDLARRWLCIGESTASALARSLGVASQAIEYPKQATSEALVVMLSGQLRASDRVLIACGVGGRGVLEPAIAAHGCEVTRLELYRRSPTQIAAVPAVLAVEIASAAALEALVAWGWDWQRPLVAASNRLSELAETKGFENVHNSGGAEPYRVAATLAAIARVT